MIIDTEHAPCTQAEETAAAERVGRLVDESVIRSVRVRLETVECPDLGVREVLQVPTGRKTVTIELDQRFAFVEEP